jgi:hypothetical protein
MAITIGGKSPTSATVGGKPCYDIVLVSKDKKETHFWCKPPEGDKFNIIKIGTASSGYTYELDVRFKNNSTQQVTYTIERTVNGTVKTYSTTVAGGAQGVLAFPSSLVPLAKPTSFQLTYLGTTTSVLCDYNQTILRT